jgi:hypothetical protein
MRGEFLAYNMGHILLDALYTVREDLKKKSRKEAAAGWYLVYICSLTIFPYI